MSSVEWKFWCYKRVRNEVRNVSESRSELWWNRGAIYIEIWGYKTCHNWVPSAGPRFSWERGKVAPPPPQKTWFTYVPFTKGGKTSLFDDMQVATCTTRNFTFLDTSILTPILTPFLTSFLTSILTSFCMCFFFVFPCINFIRFMTYKKRKKNTRKDTHHIFPYIY